MKQVYLATASMIFMLTVIYFVYGMFYGGQSSTPHSTTNLRLPQPRSKSRMNYPAWVNRIGQNEKTVFSESGEDGVIEYIFKNISPKSKYFVEFGTENGDQCNTRALQETYGWKGLRMDGGFENPERFLHKEFITPLNIVNLFQKHKVPNTFDLLSVDTDMLDYYILENIFKAKYRPRVVIVEVNSKIAPGHCKTVFWKPVDENGVATTVFPLFDETDYTGTSVSAFELLASRYSYTLVYCNLKGVNCFFVDNDDLAPVGEVLELELSAKVLQHPPMYKYGGSNCGHPPDPKRRQFADLCEPPNATPFIC